MTQMTLGVNEFEEYRKKTCKAEFLSRMDALVPWAEFCSVIEAYYLSISKAGDGRRLIGMRPGQVGAGFHSVA